MGGHDHFEGKRVPGDRNEVLNIFHITIFSKKAIFSKIKAKNNFWGCDHFSGNAVSDDKNEFSLFYGKWGTEYDFEIFSSKTPHTSWRKAKKKQFWGIFSLISVVILGRRFQKKNFF